MPELALNDDQRDAFASHLYGMRVAQLVGSKAATHAGLCSNVSELCARGSV